MGLLAENATLVALADEIKRVEDPQWYRGLSEVEVLNDEDCRVVTAALPFPVLLRSSDVSLRIMRRSVALWISVGLNIVLLVVMSGVIWLGWLERGSGRIGVLAREACAVRKDPSFPARFCLPKGLSVRDVASRGIGGIGQFEPHRYSVVISTESDDLVSFDVPKGELNRYEDLYSVGAAGWVK